MKMKNIFILALFALSLSGHAQDIAQQTISWSVTKMQNMTGGEFSEERATLITYGRNKVELKSSDGSLRWTLDVVEAIGTWTNVNTSGSITYEVKGEGASGTLTFQKDANGAKARLLLVKEAGPEITEYTLSTFTAQ